MDRRFVSDMANSSSHEFEHPSAPSPESIAASPMLISSRNSECGETPCESDEGYSISDSGEHSRRSTLSRMELNELSRDLEIKSKFPYVYQIIVDRRRLASSESRDGLPISIAETSTSVTQDHHKEIMNSEVIEILKRNKRLEKHNKDLKKNLEQLQATNKQIKETYGKIYAKAEQEEEYISNILLKRIQKLKNDKESLAQKYEQEEEFLTNDLMRKIQQLQSERDSLEGKVKSENAGVVDNLLTTIRRMEAEMVTGRKNVERMRKEKIDQENALEHEQELLFNTLGKQMDQLNNEKRKMQASLQKAYMHGFIDADEDAVAISGQPIHFEPMMIDMPRSSGGEVQRLRAQIRRNDHIIHELRERDHTKSIQIRHFEETVQHMTRQKNDFVRSIEDTVGRYKTLSEAVPHLPPVPLSMRPPSVPPTPRPVDYTSDMDDGSSRSSHDFGMN